MKRHTFRVICVLIVSFFLVAAVSALAQGAASGEPGTAVPTLINFSGTLTGPNGKPMTGIVGVTFFLYKDQQGGTSAAMRP